MGPAPQPRVTHVVTVATYNTIELHHGDIVRCVTPYAGAYYYNILNLGPCTCYYREDDDPADDDEQSLTLPPSTADNLVLIPDGPQGLRFTVGPPCHGHAGPPETKITMRLVRG